MDETNKNAGLILTTDHIGELNAIVAEIKQVPSMDTYGQ